MTKQVLRTTTVISMMIATISFIGCGSSDHHQEGEHHAVEGEHQTTDGEHQEMHSDSTNHHE